MSLIYVYEPYKCLIMMSGPADESNKIFTFY